MTRTAARALTKITSTVLVVALAVVVGIAATSALTNRPGAGALAQDQADGFSTQDYADLHPAVQADGFSTQDYADLHD